MFEKIEEIRTYLYKYLEARVNLLKTETQERLENIVIRLVYLVVLLLLAAMTGIFAFMMVAVLLNEYFESRYAGFAIMFGVLLILTTIWLKADGWVQRIVRRLLFSVFK